MKPDISIIIEWENYNLADMGRSSHMLEQLIKQIQTLHKGVEVIVLFNSEQMERSLLENELVELLNLNEKNALFSIRVEEAYGKHYYDLKNEGAKEAKGEIIVFLDSDVIPDDRWLINLVEPFFENNEIKVLAGNTYVDFEGLYSKAFALGWFWGLRIEEHHHIGIQNTEFFANNVAFRKEVITTHPFPRMPEGVTRKSCVMLAKQLIREDIPIWTNTAAQVSHPAPNGFYHFFIRALAQGRDNLLYDNDKFVVFLKNFYIKNIISSCIKIVINRKKVNLPTWQTPIAIGIMTIYYSVALTGAIITLSMPRYAKSSWRV